MLRIERDLFNEETDNGEKIYSLESVLVCFNFSSILVILVQKPRSLQSGFGFTRFELEGNPVWAITTVARTTAITRSFWVSREPCKRFVPEMERN